MGSNKVFVDSTGELTVPHCPTCTCGQTSKAVTYGPDKAKPGDPAWDQIVALQQEHASAEGVCDHGIEWATMSWAHYKTKH
jgi:hypothetical protein